MAASGRLEPVAAGRAAAGDGLVIGEVQVDSNFVQETTRTG